MASYPSSRGSSSDLSPLSPSPLSPISPSSFPEWLRPGRRRARILTNARLKLILAASFCVALGWMMTEMLGPTELDILEVEAPAYDRGSSGVLSDPSGFGTKPEEKLEPGILGDVPLPGEEDYLASASAAAAFSQQSGKPTVKGALSDLHHAVTDKLDGWRPHFGKPPAVDPYADPNANQTVRPTQPNRNNTGSNSTDGEYITDGVGEDERLGARVRVGKCTILFNGGSTSSYWERAIKSHELHDKLHGYRLHVLRQHLLDDVWSKPAYILSLLLREMAKPESDRLDWLFWFDADTIILNPYVQLEAFLPPHDFEDVHVLYSNDWNGLNNGVFPVRVTRRSVELFAAITAFRHYNPDESLTFRDQSAMQKVMETPDFQPHVVQIPQRWFNAYQGEHNETLAPFQIRRGDLLVHFAGVIEREPRMLYWLDRAEQHLDDWEVPFKSTSYPQETKDFWGDQRRVRESVKIQIKEMRDKASGYVSKIDGQMSAYGDRLSEDEKKLISDKADKLRDLLNKEEKLKSTEIVQEAIDKLEVAAKPLADAAAEGLKILHKAAHQALYAAEQDFIAADYHGDVSIHELDVVAEHVSKLREMIMAPQEDWDRGNITREINELVEARAKWQEKFALLKAQAAKANQQTPPDAGSKTQLKSEGNAQVQQDSQGQNQQNPDGQNQQNSDVKNSQDSDGQTRQNSNWQNPQSSNGQTQSSQGQNQKNSNGETQSNPDGPFQQKSQGQPEQNSDAQAQQNSQGQTQQNSQGQTQPDSRGQSQNDSKGQPQQNSPEQNQQDSQKETKQETNGMAQNEAGMAASSGDGSGNGNNDIQPIAGDWREVLSPDVKNGDAPW